MRTSLLLLILTAFLLQSNPVIAVQPTGQTYLETAAVVNPSEKTNETGQLRLNRNAIEPQLERKLKIGERIA